ncbi:hypothetical protein C8J57DRAFT_3597 [Mycena rebaudengoi]|nr:hypothetical protein C8J57DRAFT_3597 [Mycena rebaudengoi]
MTPSMAGYGGCQVRVGTSYGANPYIALGPRHDIDERLGCQGRCGAFDNEDFYSIIELVKNPDETCGLQVFIFVSFDPCSGFSCVSSEERAVRRLPGAAPPRRNAASAVLALLSGARTASASWKVKNFDHLHFANSLRDSTTVFVRPSYSFEHVVTSADPESTIDLREFSPFPHTSLHFRSCIFVD